MNSGLFTFPFSQAFLSPIRALPKHYSPGSILTAYLIQYVIDTAEANKIDFLNGNEAYKQDWMTERRERWGLVFFKPPQAQTGLNKIRTALKRWVKSEAG